MAQYWITNDIAIDDFTVRKLADNGEYGDDKVSLLAGENGDGRAFYFLRTNGDPVVLLDGDTAHNTLWAMTLRLDVEEVIALIMADEGFDEDKEWACDQLRELIHN